MAEPGLRGLNVVLFESRRADTLCELVRLQGGIPFSAPAMREVPLENNTEAFLFAERLFKGEVEVLILLTGVGTKTLVNVLETRYPREKIIEAFKKTTIVPRGPKPIRVLKELGVPFALTVPEPNTWHEILKVLDENKKTVPLQNRLVAVQEYGVPNPSLIEGLRERGARPLIVPVYRWALPEDLGPLKEAIENILGGKMDVAVFTTAVQIEHLFKVAEESGAAERLKQSLNRLVVASVGPDCSTAIRSYGVAVDIEPASPKMGPLVLEVADKALEILKKKK